jgi:hypothetical protein
MLGSRLKEIGVESRRKERQLVFLAYFKRLMRSPCRPCICVAPINFWIPEPFCMKLGICIMIPDLLTYVRSWALPEKLPIVQKFRKFPAILRKPTVHHRVHKSPLLVTILSQFDPVHTRTMDKVRNPINFVSTTRVYVIPNVHITEIYYACS